MKQYETFPTKMVYVFSLGDGGIADNIKFFMYALESCIKNKVRLYYLKTNCPNEKYIKLLYPNMYVSNIDSSYIVVTPYTFYALFKYDDLTIPIQDVFLFSKEVLLNSRLLLSVNTPYKSIHLRLGDKFLETDKDYVVCKDDIRLYDEQSLFRCIESNTDQRLLFFCDNQEYKNKIKQKYDNVITLDSKIGHTSLQNTTDDERLDTITEFYILTNSIEIISASESGFSIIASKFKNIPLIRVTHT